MVSFYYVIQEMHSFSMRPSKYFYDKPLPKYLHPKTVLIYRPHPVYSRIQSVRGRREYGVIGGGGALKQIKKTCCKVPLQVNFLALLSVSIIFLHPYATFFSWGIHFSLYTLYRAVIACTYCSCYSYSFLFYLYFSKNSSDLSPLFFNFFIFLYLQFIIFFKQLMFIFA